MDREELNRRLRAVFLEEVEDHVATWSAILLRLERGENASVREDVQTLFRIAHTLKGAARSVSLPRLGHFCHRLEEELAPLREEGRAPSPAHLDRLLEAADVLTEVGRRLREDEALDDALFTARVEPSSPPLVAEVAGGLRVPAARLDELLRRSGELSRAARRLEERERTTARLMKHLRRQRASTPPAHRGSLDLALSEIGELHRQLVGDVAEVGQMARAIDADVRQLRLTPFRQACDGLERTARDVAKALGLEVDLVVEGGDVEIDRSVLTGLRGPLRHLVRNAVGHGIEGPAERAKLGKRPRGRVRVGAALRGAEVDIEVEDDGRGLDLNGLARQAAAAGVVAPSDAAGLARLVFVPGLTTSTSVDHVSGRGIGLDVVKTEIESLHGSVDVETHAGRGTRFVISAPLTRTVVRALLVRVGGQLFAIPTTHVVTLLRVEPSAVHASEAGGSTILQGGRAIPFESLARTLDLDPSSSGPTRAATVVVQAATDRVGFCVDALESVEDVVVESLGPRVTRFRYISGATILADGEVALVLHGGDLVRSAPRLPRAATRPAPVGAPRTRPPTLLLVDDSLTTLALEKTVLEAAGYRVIAETDGQRALRILSDTPIDLIVSDVEMPQMGGLDLLRAVRARRRSARLPVVLLTGLSREEDRERGLRAGADAYIVKNAFDQAELLAVIASLLEEAR